MFNLTRYSIVRLTHLSLTVTYYQPCVPTHPTLIVNIIMFVFFKSSDTKYGVITVIFPMQIGQI